MRSICDVYFYSYPPGLEGERGVTRSAEWVARAGPSGARSDGDERALGRVLVGAQIMKAGIDFVGIATPFYCHDGKGNFLLHKRSKNCRDEQGKWDTGSGQLDFGISVKENVLKEVLEE